MAARMKQADPPQLSSLVRRPHFEIEEWSGIIDPNCHGRIGATKPVIGQVAVLERLEAFFSVVERVDSPYEQSWTIGDAQIIESECIYAERSGASGSTPCIVIARLRQGLVRDLRFVLDPSLIWNWPFRNTPTH